MSEDQDRPHVSIVVFTRDDKESLVRCLTSIARLDYPNVTVFLADNGSIAYDPNAIESLFEGLILLENDGYPSRARGKNATLARLLKMRRTEFILMLDEGTIVHPRLVRRLVDAHDPQRRWDVLQPAIYELENPETLHGFGGRASLYTGGVRRIRRAPRAVDPADEAAPIDVAFSYAMFTHRNVFDTVGTFDERLFADDSDDTDFCLRVSLRGFGVAVLPDAIVWLSDAGRAAVSHDPFAAGRSRSLVVRRFGRLRHRIAYLVLCPLIGLWGIVSGTLRGRPGSGVARAMGMLRGLTMSMRYPRPPDDLDEPETDEPETDEPEAYGSEADDAGADDWGPDAAPVKAPRPASTR